MVAGLLMMISNLVRGLFRKVEIPANPWGGVTLEWTVPSPPPLENFAVLPVITEPPYTFNPVAKEKAS
jgi:cytochrome c oxidase subunit 1